MNNSIVFNAAVQIPVFVFSIVAHEWGHARMAKAFGDDTAERAGRLTFNPIAHADLLGSVIFPMVLIMIGSTAFGWAKPVPVSIRNLKDPKNGIFWVSFAGPLMNIAIGFLSALLLTLTFVYMNPSHEYFFVAVNMLKFSVAINFILALFNLIPLAPLDGSKMIPRFLNYNQQRKYEEFSQYGSYIFMGLLALSFAGLPIFNFILYPAIWLTDFLPRFFLGIIG